MKTPCEIVVWYLLPAIRSELAKALENEGVRQKDIAVYFGTTPAAISQYGSGKRGKAIEFPAEITKKIEELAKRIAKEKISPGEITKNMCLICGLTRSTMILCKVHRSIEEVPEGCNACLQHSL
ncbi:MAG: transcriptional regulator [Candidatus Altiarchaeales archaeon HGW-Altiarchaeales-2]|nr:MAG: transcriptional regulator [Candidatus Altiarchaeales archaeon HGW-Altiarchaeales-2]